MDVSSFFLVIPYLLYYVQDKMYIICFCRHEDESSKSYTRNDHCSFTVYDWRHSTINYVFLQPSPILPLEMFKSG